MQVAKIVAFCFEHYYDIVKAVQEKRLDPATPKTGGGDGNSRRSDPTAMLGIRNVSEIDCVVVEYGAAIGGRRDTFTLRHPERWLKVVNFTREYYGGQIQWQLIELRYQQGLTRDEILAELNIGRSLYHVLCNDVFCFATGVAMGIGLVPPRH